MKPVNLLLLLLPSLVAYAPPNPACSPALSTRFDPGVPSKLSKHAQSARHSPPSFAGSSRRATALAAAPDPSSLSFINDDLKSQLVLILATTTIQTVLPILTIGFVAYKLRQAKSRGRNGSFMGGGGGRDSSLAYDTLFGDPLAADGGDDLSKIFGRIKGNKKSAKIAPRSEFIKVEKLNEKLMSYQYSMTAAGEKPESHRSSTCARTNTQINNSRLSYRRHNFIHAQAL